MSTLLIISIILLVVVAVGIYIWSRPRSAPQTQALYTDALSAIIRGQNEQAIDALRAVVRSDSGHVEAYMHLGDILRQQNQAQKALKIHQSLTVRPDLPRKYLLEIHQSLVLDYEALKDYRRAAREAERILLIDRKNVWANEILLRFAQQDGDWDRAMQLAKSLQRMRGRVDTQLLAEIKLKEGLAQLELDNRKEAISCFNRAIKIAPDYGDPFLEIGNVYYKHGDLADAVVNWERFAVCCPTQSMRVYSKVETALFELGRFSEAEQFYRKILKKDGSILDATVRLANVLVEKGDQRAALNLVEETLNKSAASIPAHLLRLKLSLNNRNTHELAQQIDKIMELMSTDNSNR